MSHKVGIHWNKAVGADCVYVSRINVPGEVEGTRWLCTAVQWGGEPLRHGAMLLVKGTAPDGAEGVWLLYDRISAALLTHSPDLPAHIVNGPEDDRVIDYAPRGKDQYSDGDIPEPE